MIVFHIGFDYSFWRMVLNEGLRLHIQFHLKNRTNCTLSHVPRRYNGSLTRGTRADKASRTGTCLVLKLGFDDWF